MWIHWFQFDLMRCNTGSLVIEDQESCTSRTLINGSYKTAPRPAIIVPGPAFACTGRMIGDHYCIRSLGDVEKSGRPGMQDVKIIPVCSERSHSATMVCGHSVNGRILLTGTMSEARLSAFQIVRQVHHKGRESNWQFFLSG